MRYSVARIFPLLLVASLAGIFAHTVMAQEDPADSIPSFSAVGTPTSPAFTLLGVAASDVERPSSPSDFAAKIGGATDGFSSLPEQFAIEMGPYWLISHPSLSWLDDANRDLGQSLLRTFTFSVATAPLGTLEAPVRGLAVGLSASPFSGSLSDTTQAKIRQIEAALSGTSALFSARVRERLEILRADFTEALGNATSAEDRERLRQAYAASSLDVKETVRDEISEEVAELLAPFDGFEPTREGLFVTLAGGAAWAFPDDIASEGSLAQWGVWGTMSYETEHWSPVAVVRYLNRRETILLSDLLPEGDVLDLGARMIYSTGSFALSAEYVLRQPFGDAESQHRLVGAVEYNVNRDLWLIASFGRDHDAERPGSLIAQLGLSLNLTRDRYSLPE